MLKTENRVRAFVLLGEYLRMIGDEGGVSQIGNKQALQKLLGLKKQIEEAYLFNGWFTKENVGLMIDSISESLLPSSLETWLSQYGDRFYQDRKPKNIGVVMAGNIPMVGFHDFLSVLITGNRFVGKLSSADNKLLPALAELLVAIEPGFGEMINFTAGRLQGFDAVIATGSNNTSRYFDYYFGKYPNIIRKNRNGIAVLNGFESDSDLYGLSDDIFQYFGLGCRNVSKLFVPPNYNFEKLLKKLSERTDINLNSKYFNNYEYNKAIYLVNGVKHYDTGNILMVEDNRSASPVSVIYYEYFDSLYILKEKLAIEHENIQCVVSNEEILEGRIAFGQSQHPNLWDYADGVDTVEFLLSV